MLCFTFTYQQLQPFASLTMWYFPEITPNGIITITTGISLYVSMVERITISIPMQIDLIHL